MIRRLLAAILPPGDRRVRPHPDPLVEARLLHEDAIDSIPLDHDDEPDPNG